LSTQKGKKRPFSNNNEQLRVPHSANHGPPFKKKRHENDSKQCLSLKITTPNLARIDHREEKKNSGKERPSRRRHKANKQKARYLKKQQINNGIPTWYLVGAHVFLTRTMVLWDENLTDETNVTNLNSLKRRLAYLALLWTNDNNTGITLVELKKAYLNLTQLPWKEVLDIFHDLSVIQDVSQTDLFKMIFPFQVLWTRSPSTLLSLSRLKPMEGQNTWYMEEQCISVQQGFEVLFKRKNICPPSLERFSCYQPSHTHFSNFVDFYAWFRNEHQSILDQLTKQEFTRLIQLGLEESHNQNTLQKSLKRVCTTKSMFAIFMLIF